MSYAHGEPVKRLLDQLLEKTQKDYAAIAQDIGVPKQFMYDLRDGKARGKNDNKQRIGAADDPRYIALDDYMRANGIDGFLEAARRAQYQKWHGKKTDNADLLAIMLDTAAMFESSEASANLVREILAIARRLQAGGKQTWGPDEHAAILTLLNAAKHL